MSKLTFDTEKFLFKESAGTGGVKFDGGKARFDLIPPEGWVAISDGSYSSGLAEKSADELYNHAVWNLTDWWRSAEERHHLLNSALAYIGELAAREAGQTGYWGLGFWGTAPVVGKGIAEILASGAAKYGDRNWEAGMHWSRIYAAVLRHLWDWRVDPLDPETGKSHLWHALCGIIFLITYEQRGIGHDDRPRL